MVNPPRQVSTYRPGPLQIPPHGAPGGVVVHIYNRAGVRLLERAVANIDLPVADVLAAVDADAVAAAVAAAGLGLDVCIVIYDGDTGDRFNADQIRRMVDG